MQLSVEHQARFSGFSTRVLQTKGSGTPIVLLHGYGDSADTWRPLMREFARRGQPSFAVDLPGFGAAGELRAGPLLEQWDAFAGAVIRSVAAEHGTDVVVVGNSLGGVLALRVGSRSLPVAGIVPIAPAGLEMPRWFAIIERDPVTRAVLALPVPIPVGVLSRIVGEAYRRLVFADGAKADPAVLRAFAGHHRGREGVARLLATGRRLLPELHKTPFELERIEVPVLLVWGTRDRLVSHRGAAMLQAAIPAAQIELLDGVGHSPQLEATGATDALIAEWLPRVKPLAPVRG